MKFRSDKQRCAMFANMFGNKFSRLFGSGGLVSDMQVRKEKLVDDYSFLDDRDIVEDVLYDDAYVPTPKKQKYYDDYEEINAIISETTPASISDLKDIAIREGVITPDEVEAARLEYERDYDRSYKSRPGVAKHIAEYNKEYGSRDYVIKQRKDYESRPSVIERHREYESRPDVKKMRREYASTPERMEMKRDFMVDYDSIKSSIKEPSICELKKIAKEMKLYSMLP